MQSAELCSLPAIPREAIKEGEEAIALSFRGYYDGLRQQVELRCSSLALIQLASRCWGMRQKVTSSSGSPHPRPHRIRFVSAGIAAIAPWVLQYAGQVEVVHPASLRHTLSKASVSIAQSHDAAGDPPPPTMLDDAPVDPADAIGAIVGYTGRNDREGRLVDITTILRNPAPRFPKQRGRLPWAPAPVQGS